MNEMTPRAAADEFERQRPQSANSEWGRVLVRHARAHRAMNDELAEAANTIEAVIDEADQPDGLTGPQLVGDLRPLVHRLRAHRCAPSSVDLERAAIALFDQEAVRRYGSGASGLWERLSEAERDVMRETARYVLAQAGVDLLPAPESSEPK